MLSGVWILVISSSEFVFRSQRTFWDISIGGKNVTCRLQMPLIDDSGFVLLQIKMSQYQSFIEEIVKPGNLHTQVRILFTFITDYQQHPHRIISHHLKLWQTPKLDALWIFGYDAYILNDRNVQGTLEFRSTARTFLGYNDHSRTYLCVLVWSTNRVEL